MSPTVYSELEPYCCDWLGNLVKAGHIGDGRVLSGDFRQHPIELWSGAQRTHFFAGIGLWDLALQMAGWPDDVPVWTGSCPCQPFSSAGRRKGVEDDRHLWPAWFEVIREHRPPFIFGEQVASKAGLAWLDLVSADLEGAGYTVGAADICAAGVGAPHIRQRLYWVAYADSERFDGLNPLLRAKQGYFSQAAGCGEAGGVGDSDGRTKSEKLSGNDAIDEQWQEDGRGAVLPAWPGARGGISGGDHFSRRSGVWAPGGEGLANGVGTVPNFSFWENSDWLYCRDGKWRPTKSGVFPLANGYPGRVAKLRAIGNAIVPQVAAAFVSAVMGAL